ncbi:response regulator transcription factor [Kribbella sp. NPDC056861]|uniref:response regulator transcription factor n=1 Tax=Kribbella sp. NPDC056861 TaxID=3154857 RepID=UPI0034493407
MTTQRIHILIVDDQELMRRGTRMLLDAEDGLEVVGEASTGQEAVYYAAELTPDVVLMDVRMPGMNGIEATRRIVLDTPQSKVLVLTTFDLDEFAFGGLRAGASGFLVKNAPPAELVHAIKVVAAGEALVSPRVTRSMLDHFSSQFPRGAGEDSSLADLTDRETEVFAAIAKGMNNAEIATSLRLSESTVKTHVGRVLAKIDARDRVQAVIIAYEQGLV